MKLLFVLALICIIYPPKSLCGDKKYYDQFISDLITECSDIEKYFSPEEVEICHQKDLLEAGNHKERDNCIILIIKNIL